MPGRHDLLVHELGRHLLLVHVAAVHLLLVHVAAVPQGLDADHFTASR